MFDQYEGVIMDHKGIIFILVIVLILAWEPIKALASKAFSSVMTKTAITPIVADAIVFANEGVKTSVMSLQNLTAWAVKEADPETLAKITALFQELQKASQKEADK